MTQPVEDIFAHIKRAVPEPVTFEPASSQLPRPGTDSKGAWLLLATLQRSPDGERVFMPETVIIDNAQSRAITPHLRFAVSQQRLERCIAIIREMRHKLTQEQALDVIFEMGYGDQVGWTKDGKMLWDLTPVQTVCFAAALSAVVEAQGERIWSGMA